MDIEPIIKDAEAWLDAEHIEGYLDGFRLSRGGAKFSKKAISNRSPAYQHSFQNGYWDAKGKPYMMAAEARIRCDAIRAAEISHRLQIVT